MKTPSVLLALFLFAPVLPAAGQNSAVECRWTDNPIIAGETPIRAVHLQEIRDCLDRILAALPGQPPVEPGNRAPQAVGVLPPLRLEAGAAPEVVDVGQSFRDPNGDVLTYSAASSDWRVAGVSVSARRLTIRPVSEGSAVMTVTAADPGGLTAVQTFTVMVDTPAVTAFTVSNIRRLPRRGEPDWLYIDVLWNQRIDYWEIELRFEHPDGFTRCFERARNVLPGEFAEFYSTPTSCGFRQQWHRVHITPAVDYSCEGCGTFERLSLPVWGTAELLEGVCDCRPRRPRHRPAARVRPRLNAAAARTSGRGRGSRGRSAEDIEGAPPERRDDEDLPFPTPDRRRARPRLPVQLEPERPVERSPVVERSPAPPPKPAAGPVRGASENAGGAERQRRYRERLAAREPIRQFTTVPVVGRRRTRPQRWTAAVEELRTLQAEYEAWRDGLPESLAESRTHELLEGVCDVDLDVLDVELPRGFGRD